MPKKKPAKLEKYLDPKRPAARAAFIVRLDSELHEEFSKAADRLQMTTTKLARASFRMMLDSLRKK